jgi:hypothetical protein
MGDAQHWRGGTATVTHALLVQVYTGTSTAENLQPLPTKADHTQSLDQENAFLGTCPTEE